MTIHLHNDVSCVAEGNGRFERDDAKRDVSEDTDRTWAINASPEIEAQIISHSHFAAGHPAGVPLTPDEKLEAEQLKSRATGVVGELVGALVDRAEADVRAQKHTAQAAKPRKQAATA